MLKVQRELYFLAIYTPVIYRNKDCAPIAKCITHFFSIWEIFVKVNIV